MNAEIKRKREKVTTETERERGRDSCKWTVLQLSPFVPQTCLRVAITFPTPSSIVDELPKIIPSLLLNFGRFVVPEIKPGDRPVVDDDVDLQTNN